MGIAPAVADLGARDAAFRTYLNALRTQLDHQSAAGQNALAANIREFYDHNGVHDAVGLVAGANTDVLLTAKFSTDALQRTVDAISGAVCGGSSEAAAPGPPGTTVDADGVKTAEAALRAAGVQLADLRAMAAGRVYDVLCRVLVDLGPTARTSFTSTYRTAPLGYGLQLFVDVAASTEHSPSFLDDASLTLYRYTYEVRFSTEQARSEAGMGIVAAYSAQLTQTEGRISALAADLSAGRIDLDTYQHLVSRYEALLAELQQQLQSLRAPVGHA